ncbi:MULTISPECIES: SEC-C metal-binding domain-containing protein [Gammaproteobacteria]|uniref:SEC-C metal-binding domain-containing protein n=1 Tax=Gammaproteobacteria TaxID=1236 RepID=UPI001AD9D435|nr:MULTISPECIES: SEC-C metal-binding domain-containing protein [Gammaproteobacteria]MBO9497046.1 SEC-C domain-containing protein [Thalassotalea sp. G20_0]
MKIGRNEPCPCGSDKKYKQCCLVKDQAAGPKKNTQKKKLKNLSAEELIEMLRAEQRAHRENHPEEYRDPQPEYGYVSAEKMEGNQFVIDEHGLVCKICDITHVNADAVRSQTNRDFRIGHWYVSTEPNGETVVDGPLANKETAIHFAMDLTGAEYFVEAVKE